VRHTFVDLGMSPLSNAFLLPGQLNHTEPFYPLHPRVCERCFLVQLEQSERPEKIFGDHSYFSSFSETWLRHAREYAEAAIARFHLDAQSLVVEVASNDGYLLQHFQQRGIPVLEWNRKTWPRLPRKEAFPLSQSLSESKPPANCRLPGFGTFLRDSRGKPTRTSRFSGKDVPD
jgi:Putative zinc binding domain